MAQQEIDRWLWDYLSGELSEQERREVEEWIREEDRHREYFRQFRNNFLKMQWGMHAGLVQGQWKEIKARLHRRQWLFGARCAAAVILIFGGGLLFYLHSSSEPPTSRWADNQVAPGKSQARLVLSTGKAIMLDTACCQLKEADGTAIRVASAGLVSYKTAEAEQNGQTLYNTIQIPRGGEYCMQLEDGTKVWLNAATELRYPVAFEKDRRMVYLKGEAYFEVEKETHRPFIVCAGPVEVKVYGTCFNVNNYAADCIEAVLVSGSIGMNEGAEEIRLQPGQKASWAAKGIQVEQVDVAACIAWKDGNFVFENEPLEKIMEKLARWYDIEVFYSRQEVKKVCLSGDMKRYQDIRSLLYYFEQISDIRFALNGKTIVVK